MRIKYQNDWIPFHIELYEKIIDYRYRNDELYNVVRESFLDIVGTFSYKPGGIDPFSIISMTTQLPDYKRILIYSEYKDIFHLQSRVPTSFNGIPVLPEEIQFLPNAAVNENNIELMWKLLESSQKMGKIPAIDFTDSFDKCLIRYIKGPKLSMGLFWTNPLFFIPFDINVIRTLSSNYNIKIKDRFDGCQYLDFIKMVDLSLSKNDMTIVDLVEQSWNGIKHCKDIYCSDRPEFDPSVSSDQWKTILLSKNFQDGYKNFIKSLYMAEISGNYQSLGNKYWDKTSKYLYYLNTLGKNILNRSKSNYLIAENGKMILWPVIINMIDYNDDYSNIRLRKELKKALNECYDDIETDKTCRFWSISISEIIDELKTFINEGIISLGLDQDISYMMYLSEDDQNPDYKIPKTLQNQINLFVNKMRPGDAVILTSSANCIVAKGTIKSEYEYNEDSEIKNIHRVDWNWFDNDGITIYSVLPTVLLSDITKHQNLQEIMQEISFKNNNSEDTI